MSVTGINVYLQDSEIGVSTPNEGVAMLFSLAVEVPNPESGSAALFELDKPYLITSTRDAQDLGIDTDYDTDNNLGFYFNIKEFYDKAGTGSKLWICGIDKTTYQNSMATYFNTTKMEDAVSLTKSPLWDNRPRMIGLVFGSSYSETPEITEGNSFDSGTIASISGMGTVIENLFADSIRTCGIIGAGKIATFPAAINALPDGATYLQKKISLQLTTSTPGQTASVGRTLGMLTAVQISTSIGSTILGAVSPEDYFVDINSAKTAWKNTPISSLRKAQNEAIGQRQYLFTLNRPGRSGAYYNDDATLNADTMALSSLSNVRVGNAVCDAIEAYLMGYLNRSIPAASNGDIDPSFKSAMLGDIYSSVTDPIVNRGDASAIQVSLAALNNNIVATSTLVVEISVLPVGKVKKAEVYTLFVSSLE